MGYLNKQLLRKHNFHMEELSSCILIPFLRYAFCGWSFLVMVSSFTKDPYTNGKTQKGVFNKIYQHNKRILLDSLQQTDCHRSRYDSVLLHLFEFLSQNSNVIQIFLLSLQILFLSNPIFFLSVPRSLIKCNLLV